MKKEARIGRIVVGGQPSAEESRGGRFAAVVNLRFADEEGNTTAADLRGSDVRYSEVPLNADTLSPEHIVAVRAAVDAAGGDVLVH